MTQLSLYAFLFLSPFFFHPGEPSDPAALTAALIEEHKQELIADRFGTFFTSLADNQGFNGTVLLSHNGKILYKHAFGFADLKVKTPLHVESVFQLASVSKQFTSAAIMMLHDQGKLEFSDHVQKYFPDFPYAAVTVRHLLGHRSGIPDYMNFAGRYRKRTDGFLTNAGLMDILCSQKPRLEFKPDERYKYSNTGYAILASLIETISELSYAEFMKRFIFSRLGMSATFVFDPNDRHEIQFPTIGYNKNHAPAREDYLSGVVGDKGIFSTVDDMFTWDQALYTSRLVRQSTLEEAFTPQGRKRRHDGNYGYGWRIGTADAGGKIIYHAGWWRGYTSLIVRRLEDKTFIIVLSNKVNWCFRNIDDLFGIVDAARYDVMALRNEP